MSETALESFTDQRRAVYVLPLAGHISADRRPGTIQVNALEGKRVLCETLRVPPHIFPRKK